MNVNNAKLVDILQIIHDLWTGKSRLISTETRELNERIRWPFTQVLWECLESTMTLELARRSQQGRGRFTVEHPRLGTLQWSVNEQLGTMDRKVQVWLKGAHLLSFSVDCSRGDSSVRQESIELLPSGTWKVIDETAVRHNSLSEVRRAERHSDHLPNP